MRITISQKEIETAIKKYVAENPPEAITSLQFKMGRGAKAQLTASMVVTETSQTEIITQSAAAEEMEILEKVSEETNTEDNYDPMAKDETDELDYPSTSSPKNLFSIGND